MQIQPSNTVSARSFAKGRRSWTSFGNPYRPLIDAKSSLVKMEGGFAVCRNDSVLIRLGGLFNRAKGGIDRTPARDTVAGQLLSYSSLLDSAPFLFWKKSYSSFERRMTDVNSPSSASLSSKSMFDGTSTSFSSGCLPLTSSMAVHK
ncbi:hypothetical protein TIFTF001_040461 [Ficus carica]|uniref:Uncharacterized protein n=1 Tax=Ficus carica TaxID=3494 RepID=A0AA88CNI4_FICCA|nr:hypothetical protein TIFTF001_040461 [Ficus carica]